MRHEFLQGQFSEAQGDRVKRLLWFSGVDVPRFDFWTGQEWILRMPLEKARLDRLNASAPLLKNHDPRRPIENQVGVIERAWIENGNGYADVRFASTPDVDDIWIKVKDGIIRNVSMEAAIDDLQDVTPKGEKIKVLQATGWEVEAIAIVPVGADPAAGFLSAGFLSASPIYSQAFAVPADPAPANRKPDHRLALIAARARL